jgi:peptidoglycan-associated lipoprotein
VLGKKRSKATFDYMIKLGIDPARMTVTTVGEEQPFDKGQNETAYASNRRSHFIITKR